MPPQREISLYLAVIFSILIRYLRTLELIAKPLEIAFIWSAITHNPRCIRKTRILSAKCSHSATPQSQNARRGRSMIAPTLPQRHTPKNEQ